MGKLASTTLMGAVALVSLTAVACTGEQFSAGTTDAGATSELNSQPAEPDDSNPGTDNPQNNTMQLDECAQAVCEIPDCPPQLQETPTGECCPTCRAPQSCETGARCDALDCPGASTEVATGCCVCENVQCEAGALPCSDAQCVGAQQEVVGGGCCICGEQLQCGESQRPCDTILCEGDAIYIADGCCECERDTSCGAGSTSCKALSCDAATQTKQQVGGDCCICETVPSCRNGSVKCEAIQCATGVHDVGDGCCVCEDEPAEQCDPTLGEVSCSVDDCAGNLVQLSSGCCSCEEETTEGCGANQGACDTLTCPGAAPVEVSAGCCVCGEPECPNNSSLCSTMVCMGKIESVTETCCQCLPDAGTCDEVLQAAYIAQRQEFIDYFELQSCEYPSDCQIISVTNTCRAECNVPLAAAGVDYFREGMQRWASENCADCVLADAECPEPLADVDCVAGYCTLVASDATASNSETP
jgi:hypothetical protein